MTSLFLRSCLIIIPLIVVAIAQKPVCCPFLTYDSLSLHHASSLRPYKALYIDQSLNTAPACWADMRLPMRTWDCLLSVSSCRLVIIDIKAAFSTNFQQFFQSPALWLFRKIFHEREFIAMTCG